MKKRITENGMIDQCCLREKGNLIANNKKEIIEQSKFEKIEISSDSKQDVLCDVVQKRISDVKHASQDNSLQNDDAIAKRRKEIIEKLQSGETIEIETNSHMLCKNCLNDLGTVRLRKKYEHYIECPNCNYKNYDIFAKRVPHCLYAIVNLETNEEISSALYNGMEESFYEKWIAEEYFEEHNLSSKSWTVIKKFIF